MRAFDPMRTSAANFAVMHHAPIPVCSKRNMPERIAATAPHPMQGLQIKLVGRLGRNKFHRRTLHCFGDRFSVAIVILVLLYGRT
jgi:hypothetical protein